MWLLDRFFERTRRNPLFSLEAWAKNRFPSATVTLQPPIGGSGTWWLDIFLPDPNRVRHLHDVDPPGRFVVVQWSSKGLFGIGITLKEDDLWTTSRADNDVTTEEEAHQHIEWLMGPG